MEWRWDTNLKVLRRGCGSPLLVAASDTGMPVSCTNITAQAAAHTHRHLTLLSSKNVDNAAFSSSAEEAIAHSEIQETGPYLRWTLHPAEEFLLPVRNDHPTSSRYTSCGYKRGIFHAGTENLPNYNHSQHELRYITPYTYEYISSPSVPFSEQKVPKA